MDSLVNDKIWMKWGGSTELVFRGIQDTDSPGE